MHASTSPHAPASGFHVTIVKIARSVFTLLIANPFALLASLCFLCILIEAIHGIRDHVGQTGWHFHDVVGCTICVSVLSILFTLALAHAVLTFVAGWREPKSQDPV